MTEEFFIYFEKAVNEFKSAGGHIDESEKMRYLLKILPPNYSYIGYFIDLKKNLNRNQNEKKNVSTFNAKTNKECFVCRRHFKKDCWHAGPNNQQQHRNQERNEQSSARRQPKRGLQRSWPRKRSSPESIERKRSSRRQFQKSSNMGHTRV